MFTRRDFFRNGSALVAMGSGVPNIFGRSIAAGFRDGVSASSSPGKSLIIVQLAGGNDGLNTVVPYADGEYQNLRKTIGVPLDQVIHLDDRVGLHPKLAPLKALWDANQLAIVEGVGYPNPNYSHFSAMHIWQTASPDGSMIGGWMGKYLDQIEQQQHDPFQGFNVGNMIAPEMTTGATAVPAVNNLSQYQLKPPGGDKTAAATGRQALLKLYQAYPQNAPYAALLETTLEDAFSTSDQLMQAASVYKPAVTYPKDSFASGLQLLAETITSQPGFRVGHITLGGFDNHANENPVHDKLMGTFATDMTAFLQDLDAHGVADNVLVMTWSEFGRRAQENASKGTDHGSASPLFVMGKGVKGGVYGDLPSLTNLDNGNLRFTTDFRSVYATIMDNWLGTPSKDVLGSQFPSLAFV